MYVYLTQITTRSIKSICTITATTYHTKQTNSTSTKTTVEAGLVNTLSLTQQKDITTLALVIQMEMETANTWTVTIQPRLIGN